MVYKRSVGILHDIDRRAYRIGIDASIWYHHASYGKGGENPEVRTLFFRLKSLGEVPEYYWFVLSN